MKFFSKTMSQLKTNKWYVISYLILALISLVIAEVYLNNEVSNSDKEIKGELNYGVFANKKSFGTRDESYPIVSYAKVEVPISL